MTNTGSVRVLDRYLPPRPAPTPVRVHCIQNGGCLLKNRNRFRPPQLRWVSMAVTAVCSAGFPVASAIGQTTAPPIDAPGALFQQGKDALQTGQLDLAERDFRRVAALDPKAAAPHINLGVTYMREKRWDDALVEFRRADSLAPNQPGIQLNIGLAYYRRNDFASAIEPLATTLRLNPASAQARYLLGLCYFFSNQYKQATDTLAPLWDQESAKLNYLYVVSIAASKSSNPALQKRAFDQMLAVGQDTPEFHLYVGKAWLAEHATNKALDEFHTAAVARPDLPLVHYFLGRAYLEEHAYSQAESELKKDIAIEPDFAYSYEDLGILYSQLNQLGI